MILPTSFTPSETWQYRHGQLTRSGQLHPGIDLYHPTPDLVFAVKKGRVRYAGPARGWGTLVAIEHDDGLTTRYGHVTGIRVKEGQLVEEGDVIAEVGDGRGQFARHLHYDVLDTLELWRTAGRLEWTYYGHNLLNFARIYRDPRDFHPQIDQALKDLGW